MKKLVLATFLLIGGLNAANAQLADGSVAPNWTFNDRNATSHTLYDYLDQGYTVFIDVSAAWCGPCWNYHNTHALRDLYEAHGPTGYPSVVGGTTDDAMVFFVEGQLTNTDAQLTGTNAGSTYATASQGDWVAGTTYPIIDLPNNSAGTGFLNGYAIGYFPTIYKVCPNRIITEVGQLTAAQLYASVGTCPAPASQPADAAMLMFPGDTKICPGDYTPTVQIQNNGTSPLTSATVEVKLAGVTVSTGTYTGNLATYGTANVTCSTIPAFAGGTLVAVVTTTGDADAANGSKSKTLTVATSAVSNTVTVEITTDRYASETSWVLKNAANVTIASGGGSWTDLTANGTTVQTPVQVNGLTAGECYKFIISDSYGDGICCTYGAGSYKVKDAGGNILAQGGEFTDEETAVFVSGVAGVEELDLLNFNVFPNPATDVVNVTFEANNADYEIAIIDLQGRVMTSNVYSSLNGTQSIAIPTADFAAGTYLVKVASNGRSHVSNIAIK